MSGFRLDGLLRVRRIQEQAAAERLSRASVAANQTAAHDRRVRAALAATDADAADVRSLAALAASRVAARAMLAELDALAELQAQELDTARNDHTRARRAVRGLDRMAAAHEVRRRAEEARVEQAALDEIASRDAHEEDR
ncbi:hypothetical protein [Microbacterium sp. GXF7504]